MGTNIKSFVEVKVNEKWEHVSKEISLDEFPFQWRSYGMFGFLADMRNYSKCPPISKPKGLPYNCSEVVREMFDHDDNPSFLTLRELSEFDYKQKFLNRRIEKLISKKGNISSIDCAAMSDDGEGKWVTYSEFLGKGFFKHLKELKTFGKLDDVRIVFWFD